MSAPTIVQLVRLRAQLPVLLAVLGAVGLILAATVGYFAGVHHANRTTVLTGDFYVGLYEASGRVDGWVYGLEGSVAWVDAQGSSHESGWPACLASPATHVRVRFGEITVHGPQGDAWRPVAWVDCRGATRVTR